MKRKILIGVVSGALMLVAGVASAQVISGAPSGSAVNVTTVPSTNGVTPGANGITFGTINISGNGGGTYSLASIPITVTTGNGAQTSSLSSCQLFNSTGGALNSNGNVVNSVSSGSNTFMLDAPLQISGATTTLTVRCNVSPTAISGGTYQFVAGSPVYAPGLSVMVTSPASVAAGQYGAALALITLDGSRSGTATNVSRVPVTLTFNGASAGEFTNCSLRNVTNLGTPLNTGGNAIGTLNQNGSATSIFLDSPLQVPADSADILALTCDVSPITPAGSSVTVSVDPTSIATTNASTGGTITPTTDFTPTGSFAPTIGTVEITAPGSVIPGAPNTGAGGEAPLNTAILAACAAAILLAGVTLALRRRA